MKSRSNQHCDVERPSTWIRYRKQLCRQCVGSCCSLPVEVRVADLVRMGVLQPFEADEPAKQIARRLSKAGIITHFNFKHEIFTLTRLANDDCLYLDQQTRLCTIYDRRPDTCRNHPRIGPRPGFCAFQKHAGRQD